MTIAGHPKQVVSYEHFFGLNQAPFSLAPNPQFIFESASHAAALEQVAYALERREPLVVITGEIGAGKTLLCRTVLQRLQRKTFVSVIHDPQLERDDLLKQLLEDFGVISKDRTRLTPMSRHDLFHTLQDFLVSLVPLQAHAVVIIDEAQHLKPDVLEQIRLLSNIDDQRGTLLQIILVGQTDLEPVLSRPELRQFQQRVSRRFRLDPLSAGEVQQYIAHRLAVARGGQGRSQLPGAADLELEVAQWATGNSAVTLTPEAIQAVAALSGGLPRVINIVCDRALEAAYAQRTRTIDLETINTAARALNMPVQPASPAVSTALPGSAASHEVASAEQAKLLDFFPPLKASETTAPNTPFGRSDSPGKPIPVAFVALARKAAPLVSRKWLIVAGSLVLAALALWLVARVMTSPAAPARAAPKAEDSRPNAAAPVSSAVSAPASSAAFAPASSAASAPVSSTVPTPEASAASAPVSPAPSATTGTATTGAPLAAAVPAGSATTGERFEIVVASFRTDAPAARVAAQVTALSLPNRQRASDGWQQVVVGPFASRAAAAAAQERLDRVGLTGTRIVAAGR